MKKVELVIFYLIFSLYASGHNGDSLKIVTLQREVSNLKNTVSRIQQENGRLQGLYQQQAKELDSLWANQQQQTENVKTLAEKVGADISDANQKIDSNVSTLSESINSRSWLGALGILIAIGLLTYTYFILKRKISSGASTIDKIRSAQNGLEAAQKAMQEESVMLDSKLVELLDKQIKISQEGGNEEKIDHSFVMKVADEIVGIETNLYRMDPNTRGYRQLLRRIEHIRNNFLANGYEIVEMLGKPYNEGMKVVANFVSDDTLAEGEQKITGIIKPQINYKGKMIQSAQITVSQNL